MDVKTKICANRECTSGINGGREHLVEDFHRNRAMHDGLAIYCRYCLNAKNKRSFDNLNDEKKQAVYAKREEKKRKKRELDKALYESQRLERLAVAKRKTMARMGTRAIQFDIQREENVRRWQMLVLESNP